jgi:hypothetical protein
VDGKNRKVDTKGISPDPVVVTNKVPMALIGTKTDLRKKTEKSINRTEELEEELKGVLRKHDVCHPWIICDRPKLANRASPGIFCYGQKITSGA